MFQLAQIAVKQVDLTELQSEMWFSVVWEKLGPREHSEDRIENSENS
jgi:hypothetical protein